MKVRGIMLSSDQAFIFMKFLQQPHLARRRFCKGLAEFMRLMVSESNCISALDSNYRFKSELNYNLPIRFPRKFPWLNYKM